MRQHLWTRAVVGLALVALLATSCNNGGEKAGPTTTSTSGPESVTLVTTSEFVAFAAAADNICRATAPKIAALSDPDGEGGQKQSGIGAVVEQWGEELGALEAPANIAGRWAEATGLLAESGRKLTESEGLAAAGDAKGSENAQNQALFELQSKAAEIVAGLGIPFEGCFKE